MDIDPRQVRPNCDDIKRGIDLYLAGAPSEEFRAAFSHLTESEVAMVWAAGVAALNVNERLFQDDL